MTSTMPGAVRGSARALLHWVPPSVSVSVAAQGHSVVEEAVHVECPATPALFCAVSFQC